MTRFEMPAELVANEELRYLVESARQAAELAFYRLVAIREDPEMPLADVGLALGEALRELRYAEGRVQAARLEAERVAAR